MIFIKRKYLIGILFIICLGSLLHFTYEWSNNNFFIGLFSAKNESVFEHTKLLILPTFLWYFFTYKFTRIDVNMSKYFTSMLISLGVSIISIPLLFYFVTEGLNINSAVVNIIIFCLASLFGQLLAYHFYKYKCNGLPKILISLLILALISVYIYFSMFPLDLPIFITP